MYWGDKIDKHRYVTVVEICRNSHVNLTTIILGQRDDSRGRTLQIWVQHSGSYPLANIRITWRACDIKCWDLSPDILAQEVWGEP